MGKEIERKFLISNDSWKPLVSSTLSIKQGYLNLEVERTVRVRVVDDKGLITIKGINQGITRLEFEYEIPLNDAEDLLKLCEQPIIEKIRNIVILDNTIWEIDVFSGTNEGLIIAEIELESEHIQIDIPNWIGKEVSDDPTYYNSNLVKYPINTIL